MYVYKSFMKDSNYNFGATYIIALLCSFSFPIAGIISLQISGELGVQVTSIISVDSFVLTGLIIGGIISGKAIQKFNGKEVIKFSLLFLSLIQFCFAIQKNFTVYSILVLLNGAFLGLVISSVNYLIIVYSGSRSSNSKLNIMQFFVGIGCFIGTSVAGLVSFYLSWRVVFLISGVLYIFCLILSFLINHMKTDRNILSNNSESKNSRSIGRVHHFLLVFSLFTEN